MKQALRSLTSFRLQRINKRRLLIDVFLQWGHRNRSEGLINSHFREVGEVQGARSAANLSIATLNIVALGLCDQMIGKMAQFLEKVAKTVTIAKKCQNIFTKAQFEGPRHIRQTASETSKYQQQTMF